MSGSRKVPGERFLRPSVLLSRFLPELLTLHCIAFCVDGEIGVTHTSNIGLLLLIRIIAMDTVIIGYSTHIAWLFTLYHVLCLHCCTFRKITRMHTIQRIYKQHHARNGRSPL